MVWVVFALTLAGITLLFLLGFLSRSSGPGSRAAAKPLPVLIEAVPRFSLTNQAGALVGSEMLRGRVWVANVIFTRCPGPCAALTQKMRMLQDRLKGVAHAGFISLTADPEFDTPEVLAAYAALHGAIPGAWHFLTGTKSDIYDVAVRGLKFVVDEQSPERRERPEDLFIHSTYLMVLDQKGRVRGIFEGLEPGAVDAVEAAVRQLAAEVAHK